MKHSEGERIRATHVLDRLRACIKGVEIALQDESTPVGNEAGQAVTQNAIELAVLLAKLDAYQRAEADQRSMVPIPRPGSHQVLDPLNHVTCTCLACEMDPRDPYICAKCGKLPSLEQRARVMQARQDLCPKCRNPKHSIACQRSHL